MEKNRRILELFVNLDSLETDTEFKPIGGASSVVKKKEYDGNEIILKKKLPQQKVDTLLIRSFIREALNQIYLEFPSVLPISGWNFFHYSDKIGRFVYNHRLATPYCGKGTLGKFLEDLGKKNINSEEEEYSEDVQTQQYIILYGIARSMANLYSNGVLHRDFKTENVFVGEFKWDGPDDEIYLLLENDYSAPYLADLGFARSIKEDDLNSFSYGTPLYAAPEQLNSRSFSFPADVYSFGISASDIFQLRKLPKFQAEYTKRLNTFINAVKNKNARPFTNKCTANQIKFLEKLWDADPKERYTFLQIVNYLEKPIIQGELPDDFIFTSVKLDVMKQYKDFIDFQIKKNQAKDQQSKNEINSLDIQTIIQRLPSLNPEKYRTVANYIIGSMSSLSIEANPAEFYLKKGEECENQSSTHRAISLYKRASLSGSRVATTRLALILLKSSNDDKRAEGFKLIQYLAGQEEKNEDSDDESRGKEDEIDKDALFYYAYLRLNDFEAGDFSVEADPYEAAELFEKAGKMGHPKGWIMAAKIHMQRAKEYEENTNNTKKIIKHLSKARKCYSWSFIQFHDDSSTKCKKISKLIEKFAELLN